jgi:Arc/MetJ family transcription regulator
MNTKDEPPLSGRYSEAWWSFVAADLEAHRAERQRTWGDIDDMLLVRYEAGECTKEEKERVEKAMREFPAVRESIEIGRELALEEKVNAPVDDAVKKRSSGRSWSDLAADRPKKDPETSR